LEEISTHNIDDISKSLDHTDTPDDKSDDAGRLVGNGLELSSETLTIF
jgi:hypothetical protein